ncbi:MAG TPA: hypothetical protein VKA83_02280, partial [Methylomirabilota bacterium]|nr:hypothetical protein [Methylomirabilota bacterium]
MKRSDRRILTTHVGSLPRPPVLRDLLVRRDRGEPVDAAALAREADAAVAHVVARQLEVGIDVGNNGEQPRGRGMRRLPPADRRPDAGLHRALHDRGLA